MYNVVEATCVVHVHCSCIHAHSVWASMWCVTCTCIWVLCRLPHTKALCVWISLFCVCSGGMFFLSLSLSLSLPPPPPLSLSLSLSPSLSHTPPPSLSLSLSSFPSLSVTHCLLFVGNYIINNSHISICLFQPTPTALHNLFLHMYFRHIKDRIAYMLTFPYSAQFSSQYPIILCTVFAGVYM